MVVITKYLRRQTFQKGRLMNCNICDSEIDEDNGDIVGNFGISPVSFCVWCVSSMTDMVIQLNGFDNIDTLQERINDLKEEQYAEQKQS